MIDWTIHHCEETASTNLDARVGSPGDVFTADFQTAGRGRLNHTWVSPRGVNLMMSAVLPIDGLDPMQLSTLPLVVGLAVARGIRPFAESVWGHSPRIKWPNDIWIDGRKVAGILCERIEDRVVAGIGVNVGRQDFPSEIAAHATFLGAGSVTEVRDAILVALGDSFGLWRHEGLIPFLDELAALDVLRGCCLSVRQTDADTFPVCGICNGIQPDGSLLVGDVRVYAGEAHVESIN